MKSPRSLKARALQLLAQREHSRVELRRKLLVHARSLGAAVEASPQGTPETHVDAVLAWLEAQRYLSGERFAESRVNARLARFGNLRIRHELAQHQVTLTDEAEQALQTSELDRALAVLGRKFGGAPDSLADAARQARFLVQRGFSADVVRRALRGSVDGRRHIT